MSRRALVLPLPLLLTWGGCTSAESVPGDAGRDAIVRPDAEYPVYGRRDVEVADVDLGDAPAGWRYFTEIPNCKAQVALDPKSVMPTLTWVGCPSNHASCQRFDTTGWRADMLPSIFQHPMVSGNKQWLFFVRKTDTTTFELDTYDRTSFQPVQAFKVDFGSKCSLGLHLGVSKVAVTSEYPERTYYRSGDMPSALVTLGPFDKLQPSPAQPAAAPALSDTTMDVQAGGGSSVSSLGSTNYAGTKGIKLFYPVVIGDDVFANNEYGVTGWTRQMRVNADGSTTVFREADKRHVSHFASDGKSLFWTEVYGDANWSNFDQPYCEIWHAPYTNEPAVLAQTAKKVAQCDGMRSQNETQVAFDGYYAVSDRVHHTLYVVRASDGATKKLDTSLLYDGPMAKHPAAMAEPAFVSKDEVWGVLHSYVAGIAFAKFQLGPWP